MPPRKAVAPKNGNGFAALAELEGLSSDQIQAKLAPKPGKVAKKDNWSIEIPELKVQHVTMTIKGMTSLITHRFGEKAQEQIAKAQDGSAKVKKAPRDPHAEYVDAQYKFIDPADGKLKHGFPSTGVKLAMVAAGMRFADQKSTHLLGMFSIPVEFLEIQWPSEEPIMRTDRVVIGGMNRVTNLAYRPEYQNWSMDVPLVFNPNLISLSQLVTIAKIAGFSVGIGEWRVERKGIFGQFNVGDIVVYDESGMTISDSDTAALAEG